MQTDQAAFSNLPINLETLPKYEEIALTKPHPDYYKIIVFWNSIFFLMLATGAATFAYFVEEIRPFWIYIASGFAVFFLIIFFFSRAAFHQRGYAMRRHDVIYKNGLIQQETTIVPLNRIQHIELNEGLLERHYKLATLQIFTAGGQTGHLNINGIPIAEAKSMRDSILQRLEKFQKPVSS